MVVERRGNKWCVIHCTGPDTGKPIKCFNTKEEALRMHRAIMAQRSKEVNMNSNIEKVEDRRPPKEWFDRCVRAVSNNKYTNVTDSEALCGWVWYHQRTGADINQTIKKLLERCVQKGIKVEDVIEHSKVEE